MIMIPSAFFCMLSFSSSFVLNSVRTIVQGDEVRYTVVSSNEVKIEFFENTLNITDNVGYLLSAC